MTARSVSAYGDACPHVLDDRVAEFRTLQQRGAVHEAVEVIGHRTGQNGAGDSADDEIGSLVPSQMPEHHLAA